MESKNKIKLKKIKKEKKKNKHLRTAKKKKKRGRSGGLVFPFFSELSIIFVIHTVKGIGIVNKTEIDVFLELCCFFDDPADVGNFVSGSSAFSKVYTKCTCMHRP